MALIHSALFTPPKSHPHLPILPPSFLSDEFPPSLLQFNRRQTRIRKRITAASASAFAPETSTSSPPAAAAPKLRVLVAGGGIGGLVFALAALRKGFDVTVFERDISAVRGEGQYRGPIQVQSNALAALEAIDPAVADEIMAAGCITGDRINGLVDGISGS